nr:MAG TPA: hypothetical protein [Bacteriophage sp.]
MFKTFITCLGSLFGNYRFFSQKGNLCFYPCGV